MENLSKSQVKVRLVLTVIVGLIGTVLCFYINGDGPFQEYLIVLSPLLMVLGSIPLIFEPIQFFKQVFQGVIDIFMFVLLLMVLKYKESIKSLGNFFKDTIIWEFIVIYNVLKRIFWAFSRDEV